MENPRPEKVAVVAEVRERLSSSSAAILTEYRGLAVKDLSTLRRSLREVGGDYKIYKNTLARFAARDLGLDELEALLVGPTAIAFVDGDAVAVAKALRDFAKTNPALVVKGGLLGTSMLTGPETAALADLPSRDVLLARIAGGLAAPMVKFAGLLQALPRNFAYGLKALLDQKIAAEPAPEPEPEPVVEAATPEPEPVVEAAIPEPEPEPELEPEPVIEAATPEPEPEPEPELIVVVDPPADIDVAPTADELAPTEPDEITATTSESGRGLRRALAQLPRQEPADPESTIPSDPQANQTEE